MPIDVDLYRNESMVQITSYETNNDQGEKLVGLLRARWALMREKLLADAYPVDILRTDTEEKTTVIELFKWKDASSEAAASVDEELATLDATITNVASKKGQEGLFTEVVRGFNTNFPVQGGVELLRGVCSCLVTINGVVEDYPLSVKNGIVLMHRSPQSDFDNDGNNEMYLKILMHGGDAPTMPGMHDTAGIRVEQNFNRPNDGLVKSQGKGDRDFPAVACWRVAWRILTPMGAVLTDPEKPLIFGPAVVGHYPPVGTHFHSPTGPVDLIHEETGVKVGTLTPGELTAFDIILTRDDEVPALHLNTPDTELLNMVNEFWKKFE